MKIKIVIGILAIFLISFLNINAADEELLKLLVEKGYITESEADKLLEEVSGKPVVEAQGNVTEKLTIGGTLQGQWNYFESNIDNADELPAENSFEMRRLQVAALAELPNGWEGKVVIDLANDNHRIDAAYIAKALKDHYLKGYVGYMNAPFSYEETIPASSTKTIERSALNHFFIEDLNWGSRVVGVQLKQETCEDCPLGYSLAVTNIEQNRVSGSNSGSYNSLAYWARVYHQSTLSTNNELTVGADIAWLPDDAVLQYNSAGSRGSDALPYAIYANIDGDPTNLMVQFMGAVIQDAAESNGVANSEEAYPFGITVMPSVDITPELEGVFSYSFINSDGVGVSPRDATRSSNVSDGQNWDEYHEFYLGGNYYIQGNDVKISMGFIYAMGDDMLSGEHGTTVTSSNEIELHGLEARLQLLF